LGTIHNIWYPFTDLTIGPPCCTVTPMLRFFIGVLVGIVLAYVLLYLFALACVKALEAHDAAKYGPKAK